MDQRSCSTPGCDKPHRAQGLCSTHYNQANVKPIEAECAACGTLVVKTNQWARARYRSVCSMECRAYLQHGPASCLVPISHPSRMALACDVPASHASRSTPVPLGHPSRRPTPRAWRAGYCAECGTGYVIASEWVTHGRYCSKTCAKRVGKRARRAREAGASGTFTWDSFTKLTLSLGNVCAYCNADGPLEPDHVVPISRGGHNGLTNILPACRRCNGRKSDMTVSAWNTRLLSDGHPPLDLRRFKHLTAHVWLAGPHAA